MFECMIGACRPGDHAPAICSRGRFSFEVAINPKRSRAKLWYSGARRRWNLGITAHYVGGVRIEPKCDSRSLPDVASFLGKLSAIRTAGWPMETSTAAPFLDRCLSFDGFCLLPARRLLLQGETPVRIGGRAFDILVELASRPGELLTHDELIARTWPDIFVEVAN